MQNNAANSSETSMATQPGGSVTSRAASESRAVAGSSGGSHHDSATVTGAKFRHGLLQLMIHTIDPMHDGKLFQFFRMKNDFGGIDKMGKTQEPKLIEKLSDQLFSLSFSLPVRSRV